MHGSVKLYVELHVTCKDTWIYTMFDVKPPTLHTHLVGLYCLSVWTFSCWYIFLQSTHPVSATIWVPLWDCSHLDTQTWKSQWVPSKPHEPLSPIFWYCGVCLNKQCMVSLSTLVCSTLMPMILIVISQVMTAQGVEQPFHRGHISVGMHIKYLYYYS